MCKCLYCLKTKAETKFEGEEHVIPKSLGGKPFPAICKEYVCYECNSVKLSNLETIFKQDSLEGVFAQMLRIGKSETVWIRGKNININTVAGLGEKFFDEIFPFLRYEKNNPEGLPVVDFVPQFKVKNKNDGFQVFPLEVLDRVRKRGNSRDRDKYDEYKERFSKTSRKDMVLFGGEKKGKDFSVDKAIHILKSYDIDYKEKERRDVVPHPSKDELFRIDWEYKPDKIVMRVIAKIAFNYFLYCTIMEGDFYINKLLEENFKPIRNFILNGEGNREDFINLSKYHTILNIESNEKRALVHTILFTLVRNMVMVRISLFGQWIYEVKLGEYPLTINQENFGCGHSFEPFSRTVHSIGPRHHSLKRGYGWFKI